MSFLTVLPGSAERRPGPQAVPWYPAVGWILGVLGLLPVAGARILGLATVRNSALLGALVLSVWALTTRFLHWDGLADCADAFLGSFERGRRMEILGDSRVGAFGVTAVVLVALVQYSSVTSLISVGAWWPILAAPVLSRAAVVLSAWSLPVAKREGLGATTAPDRIPLSWRVVAAGFTALVVAPVALEFYLGGAGWTVLTIVAAALAGDVAALAIPRVLARPLGGVTGDVHGATIVLVEAFFLAAAALSL